MKHLMITKIAVGVVSVFTAIMPASAGLMVSVDMDTVTPGIQSSIGVLPGAAFSVDLWATIDADGISSFSISTTFDTTELSLNPPAGPAASQPALPGTLLPIVAPVESNALGQVYSFNGGTLGLGPVSTSFIFGRIAFTAPTPVTNGINDVNVGYFNLPGAIDDAFNNAGASLSGMTVFAGGLVNVVPEPSGAAFLVIFLACASVSRRKRRRMTTSSRR